MQVPASSDRTETYLVAPVPAPRQSFWTMTPGVEKYLDIYECAVDVAEDESSPLRVTTTTTMMYALQRCGGTGTKRDHTVSSPFTVLIRRGYDS